MNKKDAGMSLLESLIGLAIVGIVISVAWKFSLDAQRGGRTVENRLDMRSVTRSIEMQVDCTKVPTTCTSGSLVAIPKRGNGVLINASGTTVMAGWTVRALCGTSNKYKIQAARVLLKGGFAKDPTTQQLLDWDHPRSTIYPEKFLCSNQFIQSQQAATPMTVVAGVSCLVPQQSQMPCTPPPPPACGSGFISRGMTLDAFGGSEVSPKHYGQRWMRYCIKIPN